MVVVVIVVGTQDFATTIDSEGTLVKSSFRRPSALASCLGSIPLAYTTGDGAIIAAVNQLPLAHQNTVVVDFLAGFADPDLTAVSTRHLVFVSVHRFNIIR